jgi:ABC-type phosphate transport system substrate-binding protein
MCLSTGIYETMKFFITIIASLLLFVVSLTHAQSAITIGLHGSGTTNPSQCYWHIMDQFRTQSKLPVHMTYRAVGSSTGQVEFFGDGFVSDNDFGSGDVPLNENVFESFPAGSVIHLPVLLGTYGIYHSLPSADELFLTPCLLARIMSREITDWSDPEVLQVNPQLKIANPFPITVARRAFGSSSTRIMTAYLQKSCPSSWPEAMVGNVIEWPTDTLACIGSTGMVECIRDTPGTIGYLDGGSAEQLMGESSVIKEVAVKNSDGVYLTSQEARLRGGVLAATENTEIPASLDRSFANVNLLNQVKEKQHACMSRLVPVLIVGTYSMLLTKIYTRSNRVQPLLFLMHT